MAPQHKAAILCFGVLLMGVGGFTAFSEAHVPVISPAATASPSPTLTTTLANPTPPVVTAVAPAASVGTATPYSSTVKVHVTNIMGPEATVKVTDKGGMEVMLVVVPAGTSQTFELPTGDYTFKVSRPNPTPDPLTQGSPILVPFERVLSASRSMRSIVISVTSDDVYVMYDQYPTTPTP